MKKLFLMLIALIMGVSGAWAETATFSAGAGNDSGNYSTGWIAVVAPITGSFNSFTIYLGNGTGGSVSTSRTDAYLAISSDLKSTTTGFTSSDFIAISSEKCGTTVGNITMSFSSSVPVIGGKTYYFYFVTESGGVYTTVNQRIHASNKGSMITGWVGQTTASGDGTYTAIYSCTMTITDNLYYRLRGIYPDGLCYIYSNSSNENKLWKSTTTPSVTASRYVWKTTVGANGVIIQNVGNSHYISKISSGNISGNDANYLSATTTGDAEQFNLVGNSVTVKSTDGAPVGHMALESTTNTGNYLNTSSSGNTYVGSYNSQNNKSGQFWFQQVKKVTFSSAVAVNGGDAVSTIYVAVDGSDSFTLPAGYLYSVDGGAEVSNTLAASAIAAAGTSDMTITVNSEVRNATANITSNKLYRIYTYNNGSTEGSTKYYLTSAGALTSDEASAADFLFTATDGDYYVNAGYAWRITADDGSHYFTNPETGSRDHYIHSTTNKRQNWEAQVLYWDGSKYAIRATNSTNGSGYDCNAFWTVTDYNSDGTPEADYDATLNVKHYVWGIEDAGSVTFNLKFQGETLRSMVVKRVDVTGTATLPTDSWNHACCEYSFEPSTIDGETETVDVTMTWNVGDLTFSSDYASATWYHMSLHNKWAKYDASVNGSNGHPLYSDKNEVNYDAAGFAGMWAFVGNPLDGAYVINREAGDGKVLGWTTPPRMQNTSEGSSKKFVLGKKSSTEFTLSYSGYYVNDLEDAGRLKFWNDSRGATADGSAITVEEISLYELSLIELDEYASEHAEGEYFGLKSSAVTSLRDGIKTAKASYNSAAYSAAHTAIEALWPGTENANVNAPATGLYRIRNNYTDYAGNTGKNYLNTTAAGLASVTNTDGEGAGVVIGLTKNDDGTYYIQTQGDYLQTPTMSDQVVRSTTPVKFTPIVSDPGVVAWQAGNGAYGALHRSSGNFLVGWGSSAAASKWTVEDAPTSVSLSLNDGGDGYYYATLCLPFDVTLPEGTYAYTLTLNLAKTALTLSDAISEIPAGTPVFLRGGSSPISATIGTGYRVAPLTTTSLTGTYVNKSVETNTDFFLGRSGGKIGFYTWDGTTLLANRAYLTAETVAEIVGVKGFAIDWDLETAINAIANGQLTNENGSIYNLAGQRVLKAQKGIFVKNGRKVVVK